MNLGITVSKNIISMSLQADYLKNSNLWKLLKITSNLLNVYIRCTCTARNLNRSTFKNILCNIMPEYNHVTINLYFIKYV